MITTIKPREEEVAQGGDVSYYFQKYAMLLTKMCLRDLAVYPQLNLESKNLFGKFKG